MIATGPSPTIGHQARKPGHRLRRRVPARSQSIDQMKDPRISGSCPGLRKPARTGPAEAPNRGSSRRARQAIPISDRRSSAPAARSFLSRLPEKRQLPAAPKARHVTSSLCPSSVTDCPPEFIFQRRTVWSAPPLASNCPSGLKATASTDPACPDSVRISAIPAAVTAQSLTAISAPQVASRPPSGLKAMSFTGAACAFRRKVGGAAESIGVNNDSFAAAYRQQIASRGPAQPVLSSRIALDQGSAASPHFHDPSVPESSLSLPTMLPISALKAPIEGAVSRQL